MNWDMVAVVLKIMALTFNFTLILLKGSDFSVKEDLVFYIWITLNCIGLML